MTKFRRLFPGAAGVVWAITVSLMVLLWARSYFVADQISKASLDPLVPRFTKTAFTSANGLCAIHVYTEWPTDPRAIKTYRDSVPYRTFDYWDWQQHSGLDLAADALARYGQFQWQDYPLATTASVQVLVWPYWFVLVMLVVPVALIFVRRTVRWRRARRRTQHGRCGACGYDLRATPERCPECGAATTTVAAAARVSILNASGSVGSN